MATTFKLTKNNSVGTLASSITNVQTTFTVKSGQGASFPASNFWCTFFEVDPDISSEIVHVTTRTTDSFTGVTRSQQGTTAPAGGWNADINVKGLFTDDQLTDLQTVANNNENDIDSNETDIATNATNITNIVNGTTTLASVTTTNDADIGANLDVIGTADFGDTTQVTKDVDASIDLNVRNVNAGVAASARVQCLNGPTDADGVKMLVTGTGFTASGGFKQDAGIIDAGPNLAGGLSLIARGAAADARIYAGGSADGNLVATFDASQGTTLEGALDVKDEVNTTIAIPDATTVTMYRATDSGGFATGKSAFTFTNSTGSFDPAQFTVKPGPGFTATEFAILVADASKVLQERLTIDASGDTTLNGDLDIPSGTLTVTDTAGVVVNINPTGLGVNSDAVVNFNATRSFIGYDGGATALLLQGGGSKSVQIRTNSGTFGDGTLAATFDTSGDTTLHGDADVVGDTDLGGAVVQSGKLQDSTVSGDAPSISVAGISIIEFTNLGSGQTVTLTTLTGMVEGQKLIVINHGQSSSATVVVSPWGTRPLDVPLAQFEYLEIIFITGQWCAANS